MARFPGVHTTEINITAPVVAGVATSVAGFVGIVPRGPFNQPVEVHSWEDFINKFAFGLGTPFLTNAYLSYAISGFYQNAGRGKIYVLRVGDGTQT